MFQYSDNDYAPGTVIYHHPEFLYRKAPGISSTQVKTFANQSAAHYHHHFLGEPAVRAESAAMVLGSLVHCLVLEPDQVHSRYQVLDESDDNVLRTVPQLRSWLQQRDLSQAGNKQELTERIMQHDADAPVWSVIQERMKEKHQKLIKRDVMQQAQNMANSVTDHPKVRVLLQNGEREVSVWSQHDDTGQVIKCRPDLLQSGGGLCIDLKTCQCAAPRKFIRNVIDFGYDLQQAHYLQVLNSAGIDVDTFVFIAVESEPPYLTQIYLLDMKASTASLKRWQRIMQRLQQCQEEDYWPGYTDDTQLVLPKWYYQQYAAEFDHA